MINVMLGLWVMSGASAADPFALTVAPVGPDNPRNSEAAIVSLKSGALLLEAWEGGDSYCYMSDDDGPFVAIQDPSRKLVLSALSMRRRNDRQHDVAGPRCVVINGLRGYAGQTMAVQRFARVRVHIEAWEVRTGNIDANSMSLSEHVGCRIQLDRKFICLARRHQDFFPERLAKSPADNAVADIEVKPARPIG